MRLRGGVLLVQGGKVALMKRYWKGNTYYVVPGGGVEVGETPADAAAREAKEELGLDVKLGDLALQLDHQYDDRMSRQFYFWAEQVGGEFGTGHHVTDHVDRGTYTPVWIEQATLPELDVRPPEAVPFLMEERDRG